MASSEAKTNPISQRVLDEQWMRLALDEARRAESYGDVPVGAVIVCEGEVVGRGANARERDQDPLAHAETIALREASAKLGRWRLSGATLYVTLEPCTMCAGALVLARVDRVVYGASDPKAGAVESLYQVLGDTRLNHRPLVTNGILAEECRDLLKIFFAGRRKKT